MSPGYNPDGYGDWRDITIAEALVALRGWFIRLLVRLKLIEFADERQLAPSGWCRICEKRGRCDLSERCGRLR